MIVYIKHNFRNATNKLKNARNDVNIIQNVNLHVSQLHTQI